MNLLMRKVGARGRTLCALFLITCACRAQTTVPAPVRDAAGLPEASPFLGEVRRGDDGKLISVPTESRLVIPTESEKQKQAINPSSATGSQHATPKQSSDKPIRPITPADNIVTGPRTLRVGLGKAYATIASAAAAARDGDTVEIEPGDYIRDVAVWNQNRLTIRGIGGPGNPSKLIAAGASAERKAIWVIRGGDITIENIYFSGAHVMDKNGAGIRFEKGNLTIRHCRFTNNENGILAGGFDGELTIENSEFDHNGFGDGRSHNLYVGPLKRLTFIGNYSHHANVGHLLKSRAAENHILYNRLTDETGGKASYELDLPDGGIAYVIGNIIEQSSTTENGNIISFGVEGFKWPKNELYLINNTLVNDRPQGGNFLLTKPGFTLVKAYNNLLLGKGKINQSIDGEFVNNPNVDYDRFVMAQHMDFRIRHNSSIQGSYFSPGSANGIALAPNKEYRHPISVKPLQSAPKLPGARQTNEPDIK
jgi:hypothetical protein